MKKIGKDIKELENGYDHTFCLNKNNQNELSLTAVLMEKESGRKITVYTTGKIIYIN
jgi:galactose mutarotase-like enzyme